mgnify:CR=1 FL=1
MTINSKEKQGQIWISAILFLSIGVMIIVLMLSAIMPVVDRLADRNTLSSQRTFYLKLMKQSKQLQERDLEVKET